jgi:hypothetical protein
VNLELPFEALDAPELDEYLARIDRELDALFLDEVEDALAILRAEPPPADVAAG